MAMRTVPLMVKHFSNKQSAPRLMILGFAAYLMFMNTTKKSENQYYANINGIEYPVVDEKAGLLYHYWQSGPLELQLPLILKDTNLWGVDLKAIPDFTNQIIHAINELKTKGAKDILQNLLSENIAHA